MENYEVAIKEASNKVVVYFLMILLLAGVVLASIIGALYYIESKNYLINLKHQEQVNLKFLNKLIKRHLSGIASDLLLLSKQNELIGLINDGKESYRSLIANEYLEFSRQKQIYDQIRYLDESGMEIIRVNLNNGEPGIVGKGGLKPKGNRYYFREVMLLGPNEIFISPLDLNVEDGAIETPLKPVIRFGIPLFDKKNKRKGAIILNYLGSIMTASITESSKLSDGKIMLANSDGYWLYSPVADDEWGFIIPKRNNRKFSISFPDEWPAMLSSDTCQIYNRKGLFTSVTVYPLKEVLKLSPGLPEGGTNNKYNEYYWKLVSYISSQDLNSGSDSFLMRLLLAGGVLFLIASLPSWFISKSIVRRKLYLTKLYVAKQKAESASIAKSQFLANMSHEIRTPMNGVSGMTSLLLETKLDEDQLNYTKSISNSADALLRIIDDILDYSKIEAGKLEIETIDFNIMTTIEDVADVLGPAAFEKGLELACMIHHDLPSIVQGDPVRFRQILMNLTGNAIKFTQSGEVVIHAFLEKEDFSTVTVRFEIKDTGIGIPKDRMDLLFKSFSQVDGTTTREYGGTGLGLAIAKQLCEMMGGQIGVESKEGVGTTFWFTMGFKTQAKSQKIHFELPENVRTKRILVVGENETNRSLVKQQLEAWGFRVDEAPDGRDAFEMLQAAVESNDPFLITMIDMQMPAMDGEILGRMIKEDIVLCNTIMIMIGSMADKEGSKKANENGFDACITKPLRQSALFDCITGVVGKELVGRELVSEPVNNLFLISEEERSQICVLLVDDDEINRIVTSTMLKKMGFSVTVADNGREAVDFLENDTYHIVLMDGQMPVMDGQEATREIRKNEKIKNRRPVYIIALTAHAMKGDREKFIAAGMNDYITKPVKKKILARKINDYLELTSGNDSADNVDSKIYEPDIKQVPLDMDEFHDIADGNKDLIDRCFEEFLNNSPAQLAGIKDAIDGQDAYKLEQTAHKFKGMLSYLSAGKGVEIAEQLELLGKENRMDCAYEVWDALQSESEKINSFIINYKG